jgi:nitrogen fixation NifU-like protein
MNDAESEEIIARILDHAEHPRGKVLVADPDVRQVGGNPGCGDVIVWTLRLDGEGRIVEAGWNGEGCNLSRAGASMLHEVLLGKTLAEIRALPHDFLATRIGGRLPQTRPTCTNLALNTLKRIDRGVAATP